MKFKIADTKSTFSGRTSAEAIVKSLVPSEVTEIDFAGVESITQSFASEFIRSLFIAKFDLTEISFINMNERCSDRINTELKRVKAVYSKQSEI